MVQVSQLQNWTHILDSLQPEVIVDDKLVVKVTIVKKWCSNKEEEKTQVELMVVE